MTGYFCDSFASCQIGALKFEGPRHSALASRRSGSDKWSGVVIRFLEGLHFSNYERWFRCESLSGVFLKIRELQRPCTPVGAISRDIG